MSTHGRLYCSLAGSQRMVILTTLGRLHSARASCGAGGGSGGCWRSRRRSSAPGRDDSAGKRSPPSPGPQHRLRPDIQHDSFPAAPEAPVALVVPVVPVAPIVPGHDSPRSQQGPLRAPLREKRGGELRSAWHARPPPSWRRWWRWRCFVDNLTNWFV